MKCIKGFELDEDGYPNCRCSNYYSNIATAATELDNNSWVERQCVENTFCNSGRGCLKAERENTFQDKAEAFTDACFDFTNIE